MKVIRGEQPPDRFVRVPNALARDARLSRRARGLLIEILSYPAGWSTTPEALAGGGPEGRDALRTALVELRDAGYVRHVRTQDARGRWSTSSYVYDTPESADSQEADRVHRTAEKPPPVPPAEMPQTRRSDRRLENRPSVSQRVSTKTDTKTGKTESGPTTSDRAAADDALFPGPEPAEESRDATAWRIAREWITRYPAPIIAKANADPAIAIKNVALAALKAGCAEAEIKIAFDDAGEAIPSIARINRAVADRRAGKPTNGTRRPPPNQYRNPDPTPGEDPFPAASRSSDYDDAGAP